MKIPSPHNEELNKGKIRPVPDRHNTDTWIFDLDNTLYPAHCNLFLQVDQRIGEFVCKALNLAPNEARVLQKKYFREYDTTLKGLMLHHNIDPSDYLNYVHDIDLTVLPEGSKLDEALLGLDGRKLIYTNGSLGHAENVLNRLGITHHFEEIFDIVAADYIPKPNILPYREMVQRYNIVPENAVMIEDIARNLIPAATLGMATVWLRTSHHWSQTDSDGDHIHQCTDDLSNWLLALPN